MRYHRFNNLAIGFRAVFIWTLLSSTVHAESPNPDQKPALLPASGSEDDQNLFLPLIALDLPEPLGDLIDEWYLMVDDGHIQSRDLERIYHPFQKFVGNPILRADKTWEGKVVQLYGTVLPGFRMWYSSYNHAQHQGQVLYAESSDGISWTKPNLDGSGRNTLFGGQNANLVSLVHTPQDLSTPFKLIVYQDGVFNGFGSQDGIQSLPFPKNPLIDTGSDVGHFYFDPNQARFRASVKESETIFNVKRRVVRFINSDNLFSWEKYPELLTPDVKDDTIFAGFYPNLYGMPVFPIGEQYLGLLWFLKARDAGGKIGPVHVQITSSHDGEHWTRQEGNRIAMLDLGTPGEWDDGQIYTASRPLHVGSQLWLYYSGCNQEHGINLPSTVCSIGLAKAAFNRLASLTGSGSITTKPLEPTGSSLHLNYDGSKGMVRVELQTDGIPIPGYEVENCQPLSEDSQDQTVSWLGISRLPATPFQIKFFLLDSSVYAFALMEP